MKKPKQLKDKKPVLSLILAKLPDLFESRERRDFRRLKQFING